MVTQVRLREEQRVCLMRAHEEPGRQTSKRPPLRRRRVVANFWQIFGKTNRFRLYRRRSLQLNARFSAFFKIYQTI